VLLIEQKLTIAMHISDRALVMGHGASCSTARPTACAPTPVRKEWLEVSEPLAGVSPATAPAAHRCQTH
jgi:hypothetical protein